MRTAIWLLIGLGGLLSWLALFPLEKILIKRKILDVPNPRSSHSHPVPRGGGWVIVGVVLAGWLIYGIYSSAASRRTMAIFEMGAFLVVLISWWDDIKPLPVWVRLIVHFLAATLAIWAFGFWKIVEIPFIGEVFLGWFGLPLSLLWIIGLTNIFNFMDGIDGIAAGHGILAGLGWGILGWLSEVPQVTVLGLLVSVCCLGFLLHNWAPARVFLGDVGSSFLGFIFGSLPLYMRTLSGGKPALSHSLMLGVFMVWPFLFDTTLTLIRRLIKRENIFQAHHSHLYQRLVVIGFRHSTVSLIYGFLALVCILIGVGWYLENFFFVKYFPLFLLLIGVVLWSFVVIQERIYYKRKRLNGGKIQN